MTNASLIDSSAKRSFFGHPAGLGFLAFTEGWERFSFSGMQALLVLYMVNQLLLPGHVEQVAGFATLRSVLENIYGPLDPQPLSSVIFGLYTSLVFFLPVFGGLLGDRLFGQRSMVTAGALLMSCGHFLMAFERSFLLALLLLIVGCGCLKGNITTQVAGLYGDTDRRRTDAFQIFYLATNVGTILAPLVCGTLGELFGWHYGFGAAGVGMLIGLVIYLLGGDHLPANRRSVRPIERNAATEPLLPADRRLLWVLAVVFFITTCFLSAAGQLGNVYSLWLKTHVDRQVFAGVTIPVTWFQSITPLATLLLTPLLLRYWRKQASRRREPMELAKMTIGLTCVTTALLWLAVVTLIAGDSRAPWILLLPTHMLTSVGFIYIYPVALALYARVAPPGGRAMLIGIFFLTSFVASNLVGALGRYYPVMAPQSFWVLQASITAGAAIMALLLGSRLGKILPVAPDSSRAA